MEYQTGRQGRVFLCKIEHGEDLLRELTELAKREKINCAVFHILGAVGQCRIVSGPEDEQLPPKPYYRNIEESHEVTGFGTIISADGEPKVHFHGVFGKKETVKMGCLRQYCETFIVLEAVVIELDGINAVRKYDPLTGLHLLSL
ncbi:protein of unknown function DUF296 [Candidatus Magnetoovum chiemensis]|nr:protein of unknown function DUF296 [Candidatus Magnetoovum chiemensis]